MAPNLDCCLDKWRAGLDLHLGETDESLERAEDRDSGIPSGRSFDDNDQLWLLEALITTKISISSSEHLLEVRYGLRWSASLPVLQMKPDADKRDNSEHDTRPTSTDWPCVLGEECIVCLSIRLAEPLI